MTDTTHLWRGIARRADVLGGRGGRRGDAQPDHGDGWQQDGDAEQEARQTRLVRQAAQPLGVDAAAGAAAADADAAAAAAAAADATRLHRRRQVGLDLAERVLVCGRRQREGTRTPHAARRGDGYLILTLAGTTRLKPN